MRARPFNILLRALVHASLVLLLLPACALSQEKNATPSIPLGIQIIEVSRSMADSAISLANQFIAAGSDTVWLDSTTVLRRGVDYSIGYRFGTLKVRREMVDSLLGHGKQPHRIFITYRYFPFRFRDEYAHRRLTVLADSTGKDTIRVAKHRVASASKTFSGRISRRAAASSGDSPWAPTATSL